MLERYALTDATPFWFESEQLLYVPPWCAHGFCVLSDVAEVVYKTTTEYAPEHEDGFLWNDPALGIEWPIAEPTLSERDKRWALITT